MKALRPPLAASAAQNVFWSDSAKLRVLTGAVLACSCIERTPQRRWLVTDTPTVATRSHSINLPFKPDPKINPDSLQETLEAHREANRASPVLRKVESESEWTRRLSRVKKEDQKKFAWHLALKRGESVIRDYVGDARTPSRQWKLRSPSRKTQTPWLARLVSQTASTSDLSSHASGRLSAEINAFKSYLSPTPAEVAAGESCFEDLRNDLKYIVPGIGINLVGSRNTGLATALSDVDINLTPPNSLEHQKNREMDELPTCEGKATHMEPLKLLQIVEQGLEQRAADHRKGSGWSTTPFPLQISLFVQDTQIPIISGCHIPTNLRFQIQCTTDVVASMSYARAYVSEYPTLCSLYMVVKHILEIRGLAAGSLGGLGSYPLLIMVVASLKFGENQSRDKHNVGKHLLFFLDMYTDIDFYTTGISISPLEYFLKWHPSKARRDARPNYSRISQHPGNAPPLVSMLEGNALEARRAISRIDPRQPWLMCLQDPSNIGRNLGPQAKWIKHVQATFIDVKHKLTEAMDKWDAEYSSAESDEARHQSALLECALGADYEIFEQERAEKQRWYDKRRWRKRLPLSE